MAVIALVERAEAEYRLYLREVVRKFAARVLLGCAALD
jgi:hypothetical protein